MVLSAPSSDSGLVVALKRLPHAQDLPEPRYATLGSAGCDLTCAVQTELTLQPMQRALIPTGFCIALPPGYEAQVRPRSGLAVKHGITVLNAPGTIDSDYRGEIRVPLINLGQEAWTMKRGDRIAQLVLAPVSQAQWQAEDSLGTTARGEQGFGSTGH